MILNFPVIGKGRPAPTIMVSRYNIETMINIESIAAQIKHNCNISDAGYWGFYSPCGLLLRMRDLYKIERHLDPREDVSLPKIGEWIDQREGLWQELEGKEFQPIEINGRKYDPYDVKGINSILSDHDYIYGAGYGNMLKPVFLLAETSETQHIKKYSIYVTGKETARDLSTSPAMTRGNTIIARQQTMHLFFWEKFQEMKAKRCNGALFQAFTNYGVSKDAEKKLSVKELEEMISKIVRSEITTYIHHELGEASQRRVLGRWWKELLLKIPYSRAELFLRGLKDVSSDTCRAGMLAHIIENRKSGSLGFYAAMFGGFRKVIFPDMVDAYRKFLETKDWELIEEARVKGYRNAGDYIRTLKEMFDKRRTSQEAIEGIMPM